MAAKRLYGFHPVREALRRRAGDLTRLWLAPGRGGPRRQELEALAASKGVPVDEAGPELLRGLGPEAVHNGVVAELRDGAPGAAPGATGPDSDLVVLLEDVQDPRNLGAILRVCEGAGVGRVLIRDRGSAPVSAVAVKASAGAAEHVAVERFTNTAQQIEALKADGFWVYGAEAGGGPVWQVDLKGKVALCLGGEGSGLRRRTRGLCDALISLPMRGRLSSLNVATAASAMLYEAVRQRTSEA